MKFSAVRTLSISGVAVFALGISSASALNGTSFVSLFGSDANDCSIGSPCKSFQRGHDQAFENGRVVAVDNVFDTSPLVVTKGMTFLAKDVGTPTSAILIASSGNAVTINVGASATVTFVNFQIDGSGSASNGIQFNTGARLQFFGGQIGAFGAPAPNGFGIRFQPNSVASLSIDGTTFSSNGNGSTGGGVQISPSGAAGGAQVALNRVRMEFNRFGLAIDTTSSSNGINAVLQNSQIEKNFQDGVITVGGAPIGLLVRDTTLFANSIGARAIGTNVTIRLFNAAIAGNGTGVATSNGGSILSFGNNVIEANGTNGAPSGPVAQK
jgi:hypothetical protein